MAPQSIAKPKQKVPVRHGSGLRYSKQRVAGIRKGVGGVVLTPKLLQLLSENCKAAGTDVALRRCATVHQRDGSRNLSASCDVMRRGFRMLASQVARAHYIGLQQQCQQLLALPAWQSQQGGMLALLVHFGLRRTSLQLASSKVVRLHRFVGFGAHSGWSGDPLVRRRTQHHVSAESDPTSMAPA